MNLEWNNVGEQERYEQREEHWSSENGCLAGCPVCERETVSKENLSVTAGERIRIPGTRVIWIDACNNVRRGTVVGMEDDYGGNVERVTIRDDAGNVAAPTIARVGVES